MDTLKAFLVSDTNMSPLVRFLADPMIQPVVMLEEASYNQVFQVLMDSGHPAWQNNLDILMIWTSPETVCPSFRSVMDYQDSDIDSILSEVDRFADLILDASIHSSVTLVASWSTPPGIRWIQSIALKHNIGISNLLMQMNLRLAERFQHNRNIILLDSQYWHSTISAKSYDFKMYALGKIKYTRSFYEFVAREIKSVLRGVYGLSAKLIICDLDNTLWGGVIGDDGMDNIRLGGIDPIGESFLLFQQELLNLKNRGILLAISSKNDENIALEMIENHPEMLLRKKDFSSYRINWNDKADNVVEILRDLNLGPDSVVFLDDNPTERDRVRTVFPMMHVPDLPEDYAHYPEFVRRLDYFETMTITVEDRIRSDWFTQESERKILQSQASSLDEWLHSLKLEVTAFQLNNQLLPRAVQLLNKTNQFNLATHRYTNEEFWTWSIQSENMVYLFQVKDKFGDAGYTGLISVVSQGSTAIIHDFVMSCRVMGKGIEDAMLFYIYSKLNGKGIDKLVASYRETNKNGPFHSFIRDKYIDESNSYDLDISKIQKPIHISINEGV